MKAQYGVGLTLVTVDDIPLSTLNLRRWHLLELFWELFGRLDNITLNDHPGFEARGISDGRFWQAAGCSSVVYAKPVQQAYTIFYYLRLPTLGNPDVSGRVVMASWQFRGCPLTQQCGG